MKVRFWGVRGSFATPGPEFLRYGGNTTAVEVSNESGQRLLIDLGTGVTEFAKELADGEFGSGNGHLPILLTHTHLDHIQGLPFFTPFFVKGNNIRILGAQPPSGSLSRVLQDQLNPHYSPLYGLENLAAGVTIDTITPGSSLAVEGFNVTAAELPHGGTSCLAFRISADGATLAFLSDVEYLDRTPSADAIALAKNADLLVHDAMFSEREYQRRRGWGHSPISSAIAVAAKAQAKQLALFHHSPDATDDVIDAMADQANDQIDIDVFAAREGRILQL